MFEVDEFSHIFGNVVIQQSCAKIRIGKRCHIGSSKLICVKSICIEDDVLVAWGCTFIETNNYSLYWNERKNDAKIFLDEYLEYGVAIGRNHKWDNVECGDILINSKSWIGFNSIVLKGVTIGEGSVIGAGSVVTKNTQSWTISASNPCSFIRSIEPNSLL